MNGNEICERIREFDLDTLKSSLSEAPEPESGPSKAELIEQTIEWLTGLQDNLVGLIEKIGEGEDVEMALAIQYVELKSRWISFNTQLNYEMFRSGQPSIETMLRGTAISTFLAHIEPLLKPADIDQITEFLAQPLSSAA
ncbi:MAG: hypothetical protein AAF747_01410 [Planctomycetota bacterium]